MPIKINFSKLFFLPLLLIYSDCVTATTYSLGNNIFRFNSSTKTKAISPFQANKCVIANPPGWLDTAPDVIDCRGTTWTQAFDEMHAKISHEYAYSKWRGINWDGLYSKYRPVIALAESKQDKSMYYQAIREYLISIHDGHIWINPDIDNPDAVQFVSHEVNKHIEGSYGLIITKTDENKFIASYVSKNSPATYAGIKAGNQILTWNEIPINQAIQQIPTTWSDEFEDWGFYNFNNRHSYSSYSPATLSGVVYEKTRLIVRDRIGSSARIGFINSDGQYKIVVLKAIDDKKNTLNLTRLYPVLNPKKPAELAQYKILPSGYGYLKIIDEDALPEDSKVYAIAKKAVEVFIQNKVSGVILDLRGNMGGADQLTADLAGLFTDKLKFYESVNLYNKKTGHYEPWVTVNITPQPFHYDGQVIVLTNLGTISSGEGIPMVAKKLDNLHILSFDTNTHGSFGMPWYYMIELPGDLQISYPIGRSLNENNKIQVDSDENLIGGVQSDIKIPMTAEMAIDMYTYGNDVGLAYAENCLREQCWRSKNFYKYVS